MISSPFGKWEGKKKGKKGKREKKRNREKGSKERGFCHKDSRKLFNLAFGKAF